MFFDAFPITGYSVTNTNVVAVTDFLRVIKLDPALKENNLLYDVYEAQDNDTPEIISHKFYKSTQYHWVIMILNEKFDAYRDFPKSDEILIKLCMDKYNSTDDTHHYEDLNGNWVDEFTAGKIPITNIEYERQVNEKKRLVKIMKPEVLSEFVTQYKKLVSI